MKIETFDKKRPDIDEVELQTVPLTVWLDSRTRLQIAVGDRLEDVVAVVRQYIPKEINVKRLVNYWFTMGRRAHKGRIDADWTFGERKLKHTEYHVD